MTTDDRALEQGIATLTEQRNTAYAERNALVAYLSSLFPASLERHPDEDTEWEDDWRWLVFIDHPVAGQLSWHLHDSDLPLFDHLAREQGRKWDGHTTDEKYARLADAIGDLLPYEKLEAERDHYKLEAETQSERAHRNRRFKEDPWRWQGDGEDHPETLSCPTLILPEDLRELWGKAQRADAAEQRLRWVLANAMHSSSTFRIWQGFTFEEAIERIDLQREVRP